MADEERNFEAEAREQGWKPEGEWEGEPPKSGFKTAQQFVEDGERINPILRNKIDKLEERVGQLLESNQKLNEFSKRSLEKEKAEKKELREKLEEVRKQAVTDGDGDAFAQADRQLQNLREDEDEPKEQLPPAAKEWLGKNQWYENDQVLGPYADGIADRLVAQGYTPGSQAYFNELTDRVKMAFPDKFENPKRSKPNGVESEGNKSSGDSEERTFANLPPEAKKEYEAFKRDIPGFTKEDFVANYDWE